MPVSKKLNALGAWIFAGGFTLGVRRHFNVLAHLEESKYGVATVRRNMPKLPIHIGPVDTWPDSFGELDLIYGNPPCAAWARAGKMIHSGVDHWRTDERVDCTRRHFTLLEKHRPHAWVWESVTGAYTHGRPLVMELTKKAHKLGYSVTHVLHDAQYLGAPQRRPRFFFVAHDFDIPWQFPSWETLTVNEALRGVKDPGLLHGIAELDRGVLAKRLKYMPAGNLRKYWEQEMKRAGKPLRRSSRGTIIGRPSFGHRRLHGDEVATTMSGYILIHPTKPRPLGVNELKQLCGFPLDYEVQGVSADVQVKQLSRGVCPPVGEWLARNLARGLKGKVIKSSRQLYTLDIRKPPGLLIDAKSGEEAAQIPLDVRTMMRR